MARSGNAQAGDSDDVRRVANEYAGRLAGLGIRLNGNERSDEIVQSLAQCIADCAETPPED